MNKYRNVSIHVKKNNSNTYFKNRPKITSDKLPSDCFSYLSENLKKLRNKTKHIFGHTRHSKRQFGLKENISTEDAILSLTAKIHDVLEEHDPCHVSLLT